MFMKLILLISYICACIAHLCMLSPPQRTALNDINKPGSASCFFVDAPCGKVQPSTQILLLQGGSNFTVVFQKNLDHFNSASPGYLSVSIGSEETNSSWTELYRTSDSSAPSLTLYTASVIIPQPAEVQPQKMVIQSRYVTNNPQAPPAFYQCADVVIFK